MLRSCTHPSDVCLLVARTWYADALRARGEQHVQVGERLAALECFEVAKQVLAASSAPSEQQEAPTSSESAHPQQENRHSFAAGRAAPGVLEHYTKRYGQTHRYTLEVAAVAARLEDSIRSASDTIVGGDAHEHLRAVHAQMNINFPAIWSRYNSVISESPTALMA